MVLAFGWILTSDEFKETFPKYEENPNFFHPLRYTDEVLFGTIIKNILDEPVNISEVITNFLENAETTADSFAEILKENGQTWDNKSKWYSPQVYIAEVG